ncbi:LuxR C-terminal-related transcriptional regulator [Solirubrobacter phytolaccae]|uniref:LuxR C-terminal-related transcriptional regulator n=1 Tax=Solirubrobacter phytolaccae TaxID=1404360 RepID=A0A9X3NC91_9ACTN|nr:LuxR family transcriptional regulator [Solirubrobacter phytolaccae]MDA0184030.1 LuxR C-terminal-related transcriptional regulator [Solirubrobacter phytolaccae]
MRANLRPGWPIVGRDRELTLISDARARGEVGVVVAGPPGVGKSRVAREAVAAAEAAGAATVWVQATRSAAALPLGAFAGAIPGEVRSDDLLELLRQSVDALVAWAGRRPLVLGVDDAQLLDPVSAALVLRLATSAATFVVVTVRTGEPAPDAIVSLWKDAGAPRVEVAELSRSATDELVEAIAGGPVERGALEWFHATSRGNAMYVRELVVGATTGGALADVNGLWRLAERPPISGSLAELVRERLADLDGGQQRVLELLALGEPLRLRELLGLAGPDPLSTAETRGLIATDGPLDGDVRLAHPLYGEAIRAQLPAVQAHAVRLQLAEIVGARTRRTPADTLRLARWLLDAGEPMDAELLLSASSIASTSGAPGLGATLAAQALERDSGVDARLLLARAHLNAHDLDAARAALAEAEPAITTPAQALTYLEQQSEVLHWGLNRLDELRALLDRATGWFAANPEWTRSVQALRLRVASFERLGGVRDAEQHAGADRPSQIANLFYAGRTQLALQLAEQHRPEPPVNELSDAIALSLWSRILVETGESWAPLAAWMARALEVGVREGSAATAGQAAYTLGILHHLGGRYRSARTLLAEAELQLERHDPVGLLVPVNALQTSVAALVEGEAAALAALARMRANLGGGEPLGHQRPYVVRAEAWAAYAEGDVRRARATLLELADELAPSPVHAARVLYEAMRLGVPARDVTGALGELRERCDARLVGVYADHAAARAGDAADALLAVADAFETTGALRFASEAAANAAEAFARAGRQDSARRAAARCRGLHGQGEDGPLPSMPALGGATAELTEREREYVTLAARGLSNAEIAERLVVSVRTVESHLYRASQKLGVSGRRDLRNVQL